MDSLFIDIFASNVIISLHILASSSTEYLKCKHLNLYRLVDATHPRLFLKDIACHLKDIICILSSSILYFLPSSFHI